VSSIVGTLDIVGFWNIDTSLDLGIVEVVEKKEDPSSCTIHIRNIVISNKNKDLGVMNVEVHCMS
jgi:hypothetical protein